MKPAVQVALGCLVVGLWLTIVVGALNIVPADPTGVARLRYTEGSR